MTLKRHKGTSSSLWDDLFPANEANDQTGTGDDTHQQLPGEDSSAGSAETPPSAQEDNPFLESQLQASKIRLHIKQSQHERDDWDRKSRKHWKSSMKAELASTTITFDAGDVAPMFSKSDFQRVAPKREHLPEWRGDDHILNVSPARNPKTLLYKGSYDLDFSSDADAIEYFTYAHAQHQIIRSGHRTAKLRKDQASYATLSDIKRNFTLASPSQPLHLRQVPPDNDNLLKSQPKKLVKPEDQGKHVLLRINCGTINDDEYLMNLLHQEAQETVLNPSSKDPQHSVSALGITSMSKLQSTDDSILNGGKKVSGWRLVFPNETDARRFTRIWHQRLLPHPTERDVKIGKGCCKCTAEVLW
ncbi:MAG: hypothetical protein M1814_005994 [Vezdaea aestivalis]|nr:MAG: hypothetical protein M1814_005994 [Vezdaea aestivalis]